MKKVNVEKVHVPSELSFAVLSDGTFVKLKRVKDDEFKAVSPSEGFVEAMVMRSVAGTWGVCNVGRLAIGKGKDIVFGGVHFDPWRR